MNKKSCYLDKNDFSHICKYQRVHWAIFKGMKSLPYSIMYIMQKIGWFNIMWWDSISIPIAAVII